MTQKVDRVPKGLKLIASYIFFGCLAITCFIAAANTSLKIYHYHNTQPNGITTTAYLADNGNGKGIPHTRGGRRSFNYTLHYYFHSISGQRVYSTDQVARRNYSTQSRAGQTLKVTYSRTDPQRNYLDRSVYGDFESLLQVICYSSATAVFSMVISLLMARKNGPRPLGSSKYIFYALLAITAISYMGARF